MRAGAHSTLPYEIETVIPVSSVLCFLSDSIQKFQATKQTEAYDRMWALLTGQNYSSFQQSSVNSSCTCNAGIINPISNQNSQHQGNCQLGEAVGVDSELQIKKKDIQELYNLLALTALFPKFDQKRSQKQINHRLDLIQHLADVPGQETIIFKGSPKAFWQREWGGSYKYRGVKKQRGGYTVKLDEINIKTTGSAEQAAEMYDKLAILNLGRKAKTNFAYTKEEVEQMLRE